MFFAQEDVMLFVSSEVTLANEDGGEIVMSWCECCKIFEVVSVVQSSEH